MARHYSTKDWTSPTSGMSGRYGKLDNGKIGARFLCVISV